MDTSELIHQLAGQPAPVRRLAPPWRRFAIWFAISAAYAAGIIINLPVDIGLWQLDARFVIEQAATLATVVIAALVAFWSVVPGYDRKLLLLPLLPLGVWLATLGEACLRDWLQLGRAGLEVRTDWDCLQAAAVIGIVPAIAIVVMLRRGAPLIPHATLALAAVAVAAFTNFTMRLHHHGDVSIVILVWHFGSVALLALIAGLFGRHILKWQRTKAV